MFMPVLKWLMQWLGGIPVNRDQPNTALEEIQKVVEKHQGVIIVVAPEGTRKRADKWKTGFLRIAEANNCKIQPAALDFPNKRVVLGDIFEPTGDYNTDLETMKQWYSQYKGKFPDQF
jgi:1-acyl-sn-glycerol-3-phosphate acyltransferase